jgi:hypothetical protein
MKTIQIRFFGDDGSDGLPPMRAKVLDEIDKYLTIDHRTFGRIELMRQDDGSYREFINGSTHLMHLVIVRSDRRRKPFAVECREQGRGPKSVEKFATIEELQTYVRGRWQGWDYADGEAAFHSDYCAYIVRGATLADIFGAESRAAYYRELSEGN